MPDQCLFVFSYLWEKTEVHLQDKQRQTFVLISLLSEKINVFDMKTGDNVMNVQNVVISVDLASNSLFL